VHLLGRVLVAVAEGDGDDHRVGQDGERGENRRQRRLAQPAQSQQDRHHEHRRRHQPLDRPQRQTVQDPAPAEPAVRQGRLHLTGDHAKVGLAAVTARDPGPDVREAAADEAHEKLRLEEGQAEQARMRHLGDLAARMVGRVLVDRRQVPVQPGVLPAAARQPDGLRRAVGIVRQRQQRRQHGAGQVGQPHDLVLRLGQVVGLDRQPERAAGGDGQHDAAAGPARSQRRQGDRQRQQQAEADVLDLAGDEARDDQRQQRQRDSAGRLPATQQQRRTGDRRVAEQHGRVLGIETVQIQRDRRIGQHDRGDGSVGRRRRVLPAPPPGGAQSDG